MAVVSDTSPLRYFIATGYADLLRQVLGPLIIPGVVLSELTHPKAPVVVRCWCTAFPKWISVRDPDGPADLKLEKSLDPGEAAAIQLALELKANLLLIDERVGRLEATRRGVPVVGALGVPREGFRRDSLQILWQSSARCVETDSGLRKGSSMNSRKASSLSGKLDELPL
jgi:predicted nucleic acid-binding protein